MPHTSHMENAYENWHIRAITQLRKIMQSFGRIPVPAGSATCGRQCRKSTGAFCSSQSPWKKCHWWRFLLHKLGLWQIALENCLFINIFFWSFWEKLHLTALVSGSLKAFVCLFFLLVVLFVCLEISPDSFSLGLTKSIGSMVSVQAGQGGGWSGVEDVHPLSPLETKVSIQVHSPGCNVLDDEDED